jgi:hypothetical protein
MRKLLPASLALALCLLLCTSWAVLYKEEFYKFYHIHYSQYPTDVVENIYWLEKARSAPFCNPLYALARIEDQAQYERYRYLLDMHIDLKLIEQHLRLATGWDKRVATFYSEPWKAENLESLKVAEKYYTMALAYWPDAQALAQKAGTMRWTLVPGAEEWVDEAERINAKELDYADIVAEQLARIKKVRAAYEAMKPPTY